MYEIFFESRLSSLLWLNRIVLKVDSARRSVSEQWDAAWQAVVGACLTEVVPRPIQRCRCQSPGVV